VSFKYKHLLLILNLYIDKMKDISHKISIFGFHLDIEWRGTLFFIALIGVLYFSSFWVYIGNAVSYLIIMNQASTSIVAYYLGYAIHYFVASIFHFGAFYACLYIFVRCKKSKLLKPDL